MNESRSLSTSMRRIALPLLIAAVLVVGTVLISGSSLIRIEDVVLNRVLAGTYGEPDWRVLEMNPLLAQALTLLYRLLPAVNWYGGMLLALLALAAAIGIGLAARRRGALIPAIILISPIVVLLTTSMVSTAVCALCAAVGAFCLMEGLHARRQGAGWAIVGAVLFAFAAMLSLKGAILLGIGAAVCWLPGMVRESRLRGLAIGLPLMAVIVAALFGYSSLMYGNADLAAYRENYARYERLQHSSIRDEVFGLLSEYGDTVVASDDEHAHGAEIAEEDILEERVIPPASFDVVGWELNDASLFFTRFGSDTKLTDPEVLKTLDKEASYWNFQPRFLLDELIATVKKPQFLMLIGLFVIAALALLITSRRKGLLVLVAALIGFGGHILTLANYYNDFAHIAPWYLFAIVVMLYGFNGEDAAGWFHHLLASPWLRIAAGVLVLVVFVAGMGGLLYYTRITPAIADRTVTDTLAFITPYITEHPELLYIGDNPNERNKPSTLAAPVRGEDVGLLAGSYDLYSPRYAALMEEFGITNPLPDSVNREDIAYVMVGFPEPMALRLASEYDLYVKDPQVLVSKENYSSMIFNIITMTPEEMQAEVERIEYEKEQAEMWQQAFKELEEQGILDELNALQEEAHEHEEDHDHDEPHEEPEDHDHDHEEDEAAASPSVSPSPSAAASASPLASPSPSAQPSSSPASNG